MMMMMMSARQGRRQTLPMRLPYWRKGLAEMDRTEADVAKMEGAQLEGVCACVSIFSYIYTYRRVCVCVTLSQPSPPPFFLWGAPAGKEESCGPPDRARPVPAPIIEGARGHDPASEDDEVRGASPASRSTRTGKKPQLAQPVLFFAEIQPGPVFHKNQDG